MRLDYTGGGGGGSNKIEHADFSHLYFVIPPDPPERLEAKLPFDKISQASKILQSLPAYAEMSELDKIINYLFIRREAVQSSRMEGTWSTIDHALTPGDIVDAKQGKSEHVAVRGYAKALENLFDQAAAEREGIFSLELIQHLHRSIVLSDPQSKGVPGKIRTQGEPGSVVTIGGGIRKEDSVYNPTPPEWVMPKLMSFLEWISNRDIAERGDAGYGLSLPVRLAIGHSHFEAIHPFTDGNGRTGRTLWPLQMIAAGQMPLYLSGFVEEYKKNYSEALQAAQKKLDYVPIIKFVADAIIESHYEMKKSREAIDALRVTWMKRGNFRKDAAAFKAIDVLLLNPILTSELLQNKLSVSAPAAGRAIDQLMESKIIHYRHVENRHRIYAAEELIQILARPFGSDIDIALEKGQRLINGEI